jgi:hypothetical protein
MRLLFPNFGLWTLDLGLQKHQALTRADTCRTTHPACRAESPRRILCRSGWKALLTFTTGFSEKAYCGTQSKNRILLTLPLPTDRMVTSQVTQSKQHRRREVLGQLKSRTPSCRCQSRIALPETGSGLWMGMALSICPGTSIRNRCAIAAASQAVPSK